MIKKKIVILSLAVAMLLGNVVFAAGAADNKESAEAIPISSAITDQNKIDVVVAKEIKTEDELVTYNVQVPKVQGLKDAVYQEKLNNTILNKALKDIEEVEDQAKELAITAKKEGWEYRQHEIFIDFAIKSDDHILSFVINTYMYTGGANGITRVDSYNVDTEKSIAVELKDLFKPGVDYKEIINKEILAQIKYQVENKEEAYFTGEWGFKTISEDQDYYIQDGNLVILFQKYDIAPGAMGTPEFKIPLSSLNGILRDGQQAKYVSVTGVVKDIVIKGQTLTLWIEDKDGNPAGFVISKDTYIDNNAEITTGTTVMGFYDANLPMIMIYPPRYTIEVLTVVGDKDNIKVEIMDVSNMDIIVNDKKIEAPKAYINEQDAIMVPVRAICEALGLEVNWDNKTKSVTVGKDISLTVGKDSYRNMEGDEIKLGIAPETKEGSTFVPLSFFKKVVGMNNAYAFEGQIVIDNNEIME
jgi:hypothetical protein